MKKQKFSGFTIIELLLVISIIGLLSSTVMVSLKGVKQNAKIASAKQFSGSLKNALGAYIIGEWNFNDGTINDSSGNGLNFSGLNYTINNDGIEKKSVTLNNGYIASGVSAACSAGRCNVHSGSLTYDGWFKPINIAPCNTNVAIHLSASTTTWTTNPIDYNWDIGYWTSAGWVGFVTRDLGGGVYDPCYIGFAPLNLSGDEIPIMNQWNHVAFTYQAITGELSIYLNGKRLKNPVQCGSGNVAIRNFYLTVASNYSTFGNYCAAIDEIRIYDSPLNLSQIQQNYAQGLIKLGIKGLIGSSVLAKSL